MTERRSVAATGGLKAASAQASTPPVTPDGRYIVVRGRLWRRSNPGLPEPRRLALVEELMGARRAVRDALKSEAEGAVAAARRRVDAAKVGLGERGPVWWTDGTADLNRHMARNTPYADWFAGLEAAEEPASGSGRKGRRDRGPSGGT